MKEYRGVFWGGGAPPPPPLPLLTSYYDEHFGGLGKDKTNKSYYYGITELLNTFIAPFPHPPNYPFIFIMLAHAPPPPLTFSVNAFPWSSIVADVIYNPIHLVTSQKICIVIIFIKLKKTFHMFCTFYFKQDTYKNSFLKYPPPPSQCPPISGILFLYTYKIFFSIFFQIRK